MRHTNFRLSGQSSRLSALHALALGLDLASSRLARALSRLRRGRLGLERLRALDHPRAHGEALQPILHGGDEAEVLEHMLLAEEALERVPGVRKVEVPLHILWPSANARDKRFNHASQFVV